MKLPRTMGWLLFLAVGLPVAALQTRDEFKIGDRVTVVLDNKASFTGTILRIDQDEITLDTTYEMGGYSSSVGFERSRVKAIRKEAARDLDELKDIYEEKLKEQKRLSRELEEFNQRLDQAHKADQAQRKKEEEETEKAKKETDEGKKVESDKKLLEGMDLLKKFPPSDGWGEDKYKTLKSQFVKTGVQLTKTEKEFADNYELWKSAKDSLEQALKGGEKPAAEGEKPEGEETEQPPAPSGEGKTPAPSGSGKPTPPAGGGQPPSPPAGQPQAPPKPPPASGGAGPQEPAPMEEQPPK